jgi:hypothetical protein
MSNHDPYSDWMDLDFGFCMMLMTPGVKVRNG